MGVIPPWADLPSELLSLISQFLSSNPIEILSFLSVCKSWSSSSSHPPNLCPPLPLTIPPVSSLLRDRYSCFTYQNPHHILSVTMVYSLRPNSGFHNSTTAVPGAWLLFLDQSHPGKVSIRKPFSRLSYSYPLNFPQNLDLLKFHAAEITRFYSISPCLDKDGKLTRLSNWSGVVRKVVLLSTGCGFGVVALSEEGKLGLLRLGLGYIYEVLGDQVNWDLVHDGKGFQFDDIVDFKGRVLGIDRRGRVYKVEIGCYTSSPAVIESFVPPIAGGGGRRKRLVESLGCLYLVVRNNLRGTIDPLFKVYQLNEGNKKWVEVNSLGDRTFFFGLEFSFSALAEGFHGSYGKNCVVFKEQSFLNYSGYDDDYALFHKLNSDKLPIGVWKLEDAPNLGAIGSIPGYSYLFWPPPTWIWENDLFERVATLLTALDHLQTLIPDHEKLEEKLDELSVRQQNCALTIIKSGITMKGLLDQARKIDEILLKKFSEALQQHSKSSNLHNQEGTITHETEDQCVSGGALSKMLQHLIKECSKIDIDVLSWLMELHSYIFSIEENTSKLQDIVNSRKFSASMDELTDLLNST